MIDPRMPEVQMMFLFPKSFSKSCDAINKQLQQGWRLIGINTDKAYFERHVPTTLNDALAFLAELHTSPDSTTGFDVRCLTSPNDWPSLQRSTNINAWRVVRQWLDLPVEPEPENPS